MAIIISILNQKGGAGKTTTACHLARGLQLLGSSVMLVDTDKQASARDWSAANESQPVPVVGLDRKIAATDIKELERGRDFIILDGAPQIDEWQTAAIKVSDLVIIPVQPSPLDLWACHRIVEKIKDRQEMTDGQLKAVFMISRRTNGTRIGKEVAGVLQEFGLPVLASGTAQRVSYADSMSNGLTVMDVARNSVAAQEFMAIVAEIKGML